MNKKITEWFAVADAPATPGPKLKIEVVALLCAMVALWTLLCGISHQAPDLDGMEQLVWASSFELGYYKHPPLPSWVLYPLTALVGKPVWLVFFAGQVFSALGLWFVWLLGCEFTTPRIAAIATLLVSTTIYFSLRGTIYNHNTVQLWSIAASTWLLYRALRYQMRSTWLWLGIVSGLAMLTKYSALIQFAVFFCFMVRQGHLRESATRTGILYALAAFLIVISPHIYWLSMHGFEALRYADQSVVASGGYADAWLDIVYFTQDQLARLSPMLVAFGVLLYWNRTRPPVRLSELVSPPQPYARALSAWDRSFLLWVGLAPFILTVVVSGVLGTRLVASWGTTFFILYGFYVFWWLAGNEQLNLRRTLIIVIVIHVVMAAGYALARGPIAQYTGRTARSTFPGAAISARMSRIWDEHVSGVPLTLVASDTWLGGNIATHAGTGAKVFIDADYGESPWLDPASALDCGVLIAYDEAGGGNLPPALATLLDQSVWQGVEPVQWSGPRGRAVIVRWGIIPPLPACREPAR